MAPMYEYKAYSADGKAQKGLIEADSQKTARQKLKKQGLMPTDINEKGAIKTTSSGSPGAAQQPAGGLPFVGNRVGVRDISLMTRQLASLIKANIPLVEALTALVEQIERPALRVALSQVRQDVNEGISLARAMGKHPKIFDTIFVNMVEAGESSGTLTLVLMRLADLKEAQMRLRSKVISGMTYPALMLTVAVVLVLAIFTFVIPKLAKVFDSMNKPMPAVTKFLIWFSGWLVDWWWLLAAATFVAVVIFKRSISTPSGKARWDAFKLRTPLFGPLIRMVAVTRFASTMATLLGSGVPILTAMNIAKNLVGNDPIANAIAVARENITEGQSIAEPLRRSGEFPPLVIHMIAIGEKTGELPGMLTNIAETYEEQVNAKIDGMTALLEPVMIIGMGGFVGFIVMAIMIPLMDIGNIK